MRHAFASVPLTFVRDAAWLDRERATAYARILLALTLLLAAGWIFASRHGLDPTGKPLGTDFLSFWSAARLALAGWPQDAYDVVAHHAAQTSVFGQDVGYYAFFYPPAYLLVCLPLGLLPYGWALAAWIVATGSAYCVVLRRMCGGTALPWLAFPAVLLTVGHGQNALLTTALFGGGLLFLDRRPVLAGCLLGGLVVKPHLALLLPVFLIASGRWRALVATAGAAALLCGASLLVFGVETWSRFFAVAPLARKTLEQGWVEPEKMVSVFAAVRLWGGSIADAYAAQAIVTVGAAVLLVRFVRRVPTAGPAGAALVAASLLASPFLLDYDLTLLAIPLAWLFAQGRADGFQPWEKVILLLAFVLPLLVRAVAQAGHVPLGPPIVALLFLAVLRRGRERCFTHPMPSGMAVALA